MQLGAAFAGGADIGDGEARIVGHGDERCLAVAGVAFDADLFGVHGLVGFEIIERAAGAPGPGAQRAPIVGLARLAFVDQADDALRQTGAVVGLNAGGDEVGVAPAFGENLLLPAWDRWAGAARAGGRASGRRTRRQDRRAKPNCMITGTGPVALAGVESDSWMSTVIAG